MKFSDLIQDTPYHTDAFLIKTLGFKPTQSENIMRNNYAQARVRVINSEFDGDTTDFVSVQDIIGGTHPVPSIKSAASSLIFPDIKTFMEYTEARPLVLSYIISAKADADDKRKEIHEYALDEMRAILSMPNEIPDPNYKSSGPDDTPPMITDHKTLSLKVNLFKHLDGQATKQVIHNQNINIKVAMLSSKSGQNPTLNPTLIGGNPTLNPVPLHHRARIVSQHNNNPDGSKTGPDSINSNSSNTINHNSPINPSKKYNSPKQILDDVISGEGDMVIDVTPKKKELMKEDESILISKLESLREQELLAQHATRAKPVKSGTLKVEDVIAGAEKGGKLETF